MPGESPRRRRFVHGFRLGRHAECALRFSLDVVSRLHAEVYLENSVWWIRDLDSANGTYLSGKLIDRAPLHGRCVVQLGADGPYVTLLSDGPAPAAVKSPPSQDSEDRTVLRPPGRVIQADCTPSPGKPIAGATTTSPTAHPAEQSGTGQPSSGRDRRKAATDAPSSIKEVADYYFSNRDDDEAGERTQMLRRAFRQEQQKQTQHHRRRYTLILGFSVSLLAMLAVALGTLVWQHQKVEKAKALAIDLFYDIKTMEIDLAQLEERVSRTREVSLMAEMKKNRAKLREMSQRYQKYVDEMVTEAPEIDEEDLLILHVARIFGECELNMPEDFKQEVKDYIKKWQSSGRLARAIRTLEARGYADIIHDAMSSQGLPSQFLYLGLQESNFNERAIGPQTRYGIAKGAWQFIPDTAIRFGLEVGPLKGVREFDPADQRFNFGAAAYAAARYLRYIYNTDAQASGLLVMASYNWGEGNIIKRIRQLPENPRERNFWQLVNKYKIPDETYNYVLYIVSAAVIGQNPGLFGFDFDNPLDGLVEEPELGEGVAGSM